MSKDVKFDIVVIGGGISGTMAAIASARQGSKTLLIDRYGALGGMATSGLVQPITTWGINDSYVISGTGKKILENMASKHDQAATAMSTYGPTCDAEYLKKELEDIAIENGVSLLYHTWVRSVEMKSTDVISHITAFSKNGDFNIYGKVFIDATADGDICAFAGVPFESSEDSEGQQAMTLMMIVSGIDQDRILDREKMQEIWDKHRVNSRQLTLFWHPRKGSTYVNMTSISSLNGLDPTDLTKATIECRKQAWDILDVFRNYMPGFENAYIEQTAPTLGIRETRRIKGQYILSADDILSGREFNDSIARASCPIDIHPRNNEPAVYQVLKKSYSIPYRALITNEISNLIATGRCISTDQEAHSSVRRMGPGFALGEAAGIAAALALENNDVRNISINQLQTILKSYNGII
ncbi:MAG: FAD-dependent oxidoreductase [Clostridiales bacterium]|nr:FAD-dependent oxidoreductase [Clostridiales bacterium]